MSCSHRQPGTLGEADTLLGSVHHQLVLRWLTAEDKTLWRLVAEGLETDSPDESQHVLAMRAANPDVVLSFTWPSAVAKFMHDANAQKWKPRLGYIANHMTADPGYGSIFGDYIKDQTYTITSWGVPTAPDPDNPEGTTTEQRLLVDELLRTNGREFQGFKWRYAQPYSFNREFIYKWVAAPDGGWDMKRILPDPVFDCKAPNIPAGAKTVCTN